MQLARSDVGDGLVVVCVGGGRLVLSRAGSMRTRVGVVCVAGIGLGVVGVYHGFGVVFFGRMWLGDGYG